MKKFKIVYFVALVAVTLLATSCGSVKNMLSQASDIKWSVTPDVLEMHGDKVQITITGKIPPKYFHKKGILVVSPVLKYKGGEKIFDNKTFQGEGISGNNKVILFETGKIETGGELTFSATIPYEDDMLESDLVLKLVASDEKGNKYSFPDTILAKGIIITPRLVTEGMGVDNAGFNNAGNNGLTASESITLAEKATSYFKADLHYDLQRYNLKGSELKEADIVKLIEDVKAAQEAELVFKGIKVSSYASPEGELDLNTKLSGKRGKTAEKYITKALKKADIDVADLLKATTTPEDWEGFKTELSKTSVQDKDLILRVLNMYKGDAVKREEEIKNLAEAYEGLKTDVLPKLRRSKFNLEFETSKRTNAEILEAMQNDPTQLTAEEMLHGAAVTKNFNDKIVLYKKAIEFFPEDWRMYNNMGIALLNLNKLEDAKDAFGKAKDLDDNEKVNNNLGVVLYANAEVEEAAQFFSLAATPEANYNLAVIDILNGEYETALGKFSDTKCTFNHALTQVLSKDYAGALNSLNCVANPEHALVYYLKAIIGARNDDATALENLKLAINKDASLKERARTDREFLKYSQDDTFLSIVK